MPFTTWLLPMPCLGFTNFVWAFVVTPSLRNSIAWCLRCYTSSWVLLELGSIRFDPERTRWPLELRRARPSILESFGWFGNGYTMRVDRELIFLHDFLLGVLKWFHVEQYRLDTEYQRGRFIRLTGVVTGRLSSLCPGFYVQKKSSKQWPVLCKILSNQNRLWLGLDLLTCLGWKKGSELIRRVAELVVTWRSRIRPRGLDTARLFVFDFDYDLDLDKDKDCGLLWQSRYIYTACLYLFVAVDMWITHLANIVNQKSAAKWRSHYIYTHLRGKP